MDDPIFKIIPIDITKIIAIPINIPDIVLYIEAKLDITFVIFSSLHIGSAKADNMLYIILIEIILITGMNITHIIATIPTVPPTLLTIFVAPTTVSKLSEKNLPTTGTKFDTAADVVFIAKESTEDDIEVSSERIPRNTVSITPIIHVDVLVNILLNLESPTLVFKLCIILNATDILKKGTTTLVIIYPINELKNNNKGCIIPVVVIPPVAISTAIKNGDITCISVVTVTQVSLKVPIVCKKVVIIIIAKLKKHTKSAICIIPLPFLYF